MADVMTFEELRGAITGKNILWLGDGNNVCASTLHAAGQFGFNFTFSGPESLNPKSKYLEYAKSKNILVNIDPDPENAIKNADLIMTDTWSSMHEKKELNYEARQKQLIPFQVNEQLISKSKDEAIFMHCLPAYRGQEVTSDVIDGKKSVVFDQAENRLHIQKSILEWCILGRI
jgi:ornithine carbamoyltransferase